MAQKKNLIRKGTKKISGKNLSKKSVTKPTKKAAKSRSDGKAPSLAKKKKSWTAKKSTVKKGISQKVFAKTSKATNTTKSTRTMTNSKKTESTSVKPKKTTGGMRSAKSSTAPSSYELTPTERYNIGGLFACAIDRASDPDYKRLRSVLRELELSALEKDNLIVLSQGFTIPKLFADGVASNKVEKLIGRLMTFALKEKAYERAWRNDIRQVAAWLGLFGSEVAALEQRMGIT